MDGQAAILTAAIAVQLYSATDEVRSLLADDTVGHLQTLSMNAVSVISTLLTVVRTVRLRRIRRSMRRVERSLQAPPATDGFPGTDGRHWPAEYRSRACLAVAVTVFGYLKYGQLMFESAAGGGGGGGNAYTTAAVALLRTVSVAGNYYVTVMFVDHVILAKR